MHRNYVYISNAFPRSVPEHDRTFLLKITNSAEDPEETAMQTATLLHIKQMDPQYPVPAVIMSQDGQNQTWVTSRDGSKHIVRAFTFLPGNCTTRLQLYNEGVTGETLFHDIDSTVRSELLRNSGQTLALLGKHMRGLFHHKSRRGNFPTTNCSLSS
jgi:Ser/Thr protein kinase RdoA (MazF antagonist)